MSQSHDSGMQFARHDVVYCSTIVPFVSPAQLSQGLKQLGQLFYNTNGKRIKSAKVELSSRRLFADLSGLVRVAIAGMLLALVGVPALAVLGCAIDTLGRSPRG